MFDDSPSYLNSTAATYGTVDAASAPKTRHWSEVGRTVNPVPTMPAVPLNYTPPQNSPCLASLSAFGAANGEAEQKGKQEEKIRRAGKLYGSVTMWTGPIAMGVGYYRTRSIWKAFLLGFISLPYLIYVGVDEMGKKK
jgi:hypothetical protein